MLFRSEVSAGPGERIFALLNLQSLPELLQLNFAPMFEKGFAYTDVFGSFDVENGNAYTNNLVVQSKTARMNIAGRTGLTSEDYDQTITITPSLSDTLPIAGAALGGVGAGVGAAIWLAERLFDTSIVDEAAAFRYHVTGPWKSPKFTRVDEVPEDDKDR